MNPRLNERNEQTFHEIIISDGELLVEQDEPIRNVFWQNGNNPLIELHRYLAHEINSFMYSRLHPDVIFGLKAFQHAVLDLTVFLTAIETIGQLLDDDFPESLHHLYFIFLLIPMIVHLDTKLKNLQINIDYGIMNHLRENADRRERDLLTMPNRGFLLFRHVHISRPFHRVEIRRLARYTWITPEANANQAGYSYLVTSREHQRLRYFLNRETFAALDPVNELKIENLLVLDGYAFAINELIAYACTTLPAIYRNPHLITRGMNTDFSVRGLERLRNHPVMRPYILRFENHMLNQFKEIKAETIAALLLMLNKINQAKIENELNAARQDFIAYMSTLNQWEQRNLIDFVISVELTQGGYQRMTFGGALGGGYSDCVHIVQVFLWQFLVTQRPDYLKLVPEPVHGFATSSFLKITAPSQENQISQTPVRPTSIPTQPQEVRFVADLSIFNPNPTRRRLSGRLSQQGRLFVDDAKEDSTVVQQRRFGL